MKTSLIDSKQYQKMMMTMMMDKMAFATFKKMIQCIMGRRMDDEKMIRIEDDIKLLP